MFKRGDLVRSTIYPRLWTIDVEPWDERGPTTKFSGEVLEILEVRGNYVRMWCPELNCYVSRVNIAILKKINV